MDVIEEISSQIKTKLNEAGWQHFFLTFDGDYGYATSPEFSVITKKNVSKITDPVLFEQLNLIWEKSAIENGK